jgi:predicted DNA-binding transcriptional regulator AlpA
VPTKTSRRHHLDRRVDQLLAIAAVPTTPAINDDDELLNTKQLAAWLGVSEQWLEFGRAKGYRPDFKSLGPRCIRYRRGDVIKWLKSRTRVYR